MHHPPATPTEKIHHASIRKVLAFIQENLPEDLSLERLAAIACFSPFHFQRIFTQYVGESPKKYIIRLRLERIAHYLVLYPGLSVNEAALQCGFSSPSTFIRAFKKYYSLTPEAFRSLSCEEISQFSTLKPNIGKSFVMDIGDFCTVTLPEEEIQLLSSGLNIEVKLQHTLKIAFIETHLGYEDAIPTAFKALLRWAEPRDLITPDTQFIGVMLDLPLFTAIDKCRYRAGITVDEETIVPKDSNIAILTAGKHAVYDYKGSFHNVFNSLIAFHHGWLNSSGYTIAEVMGYEVYSENPALKPYESIQRQIVIPIKPA